MYLKENRVKFVLLFTESVAVVDTIRYSSVRLSCVRIKLSRASTFFSSLFNFLLSCVASHERVRLTATAKYPDSSYEQLIAASTGGANARKALATKVCCKSHWTLLIHSIAVRCSRTRKCDARYQFHWKCVLAMLAGRNETHSITLFMTLVSWFCTFNNQMDNVSRFLLCEAACMLIAHWMETDTWNGRTKVPINFIMQKKRKQKIKRRREIYSKLCFTWECSIPSYRHTVHTQWQIESRTQGTKVYTFTRYRVSYTDGVDLNCEFVWRALDAQM